MSRIAKRLGLNVFDIPMGLFEFSVRIVIGEQRKAEEYAAHVFELKDWQYDNDYEIPRGFCFYSRGYIPILWLPKKPETPREIATLAHEAGHAVTHLFTWAHMIHEDSTDELYQHALAHIVNDALERIK